MSLASFLVLLVVAGVCGSLGQSIAGFSRSGCLGSIALGFVGAWLGAWLAGLLHLPEVFVITVARERFPVVWSIVGSALFVAVLSALRRRD